MTKFLVGLEKFLHSLTHSFCRHIVKTFTFLYLFLKQQKVLHLFCQHPTHRSKPCIACSDFFQKVRVRSRRCFSFPNRTRSIGLRLGGASAGRNALILLDCRETTVSPTDCEQTVRSVLLLCKGNRRAGDQRARCPVFRA